MPLLLVRESGDTADAVDLSEWCWWNWLEHVSDLARSILVQSIEMFCSHQPIVVNGSKT